MAYNNQSNIDKVRKKYGFKVENSEAKNTLTPKENFSSDKQNAVNSIRAKYGLISGYTPPKKLDTTSDFIKTENNTNSEGKSFEGRYKPSTKSVSSATQNVGVSTNDVQKRYDEIDQELINLYADAQREYSAKVNSSDSPVTSYLGSYKSDIEALLKEKNELEKQLNVNKAKDYYNKGVSTSKELSPEVDKLLSDYVQVKQDSEIVGGVALANERLRLSNEIKKLTGWSEKEFTDYADQYTYVKNQNDAAEREAELTEYAKEHQVGASVLRTANNVLSGLGAVDIAIQKLENRGTDKPIDTNTYLNTWANESRIAEEAVLSTIESDLGKAVYSTAMSMIDSAINAGIGSAVGGLFEAPKVAETVRALTVDFVIGSGVAAKEFKSNIEKGYSETEALISSVIKGAIEGVTEAISIDKILGEVKKGEKLWKMFAKAGATEAQEELASNWLGRIVDYVIDGGEEYRATYENYLNEALENGKSKKEAFAYALWNTIGKEDLTTVLLSFLSGGVMGSGFSAVSRVPEGIAKATEGISNAIGRASENASQYNDIRNNYANYQNNDNSRNNMLSLIEEGKTFGEDSVAYGKADALQSKMYGGKNISAREIQNVINEYAKARANNATEASESVSNESGKVSQTTNKTATQPNVLEKKNTSIKPAEAKIINAENNVEAVSINLFSNSKKGEVYLSNGQIKKLNEVDFANAQERIVYEAARKFDTEVANDMIDGNTGTSNYADAFTHFYQRGVSGQDFNFGSSVYDNDINQIVAQQAFADGRKVLNANLKANNGGVTNGHYLTRDYNSNTTKLSRSVSSQLNVLEAYANKHKIRISVVKTIDGGKSNGMYIPATDTIVVALDSKEGAILGFAGHEIAHRIKAQSKEAFAEIEKIVLDYLKKDKNFDLDKRIASIQALYKRNGIELTRPEAVEEIVANSIIPAFSDEAFVENVVDENPSLAKKIRKWIDEFIKELKSIVDRLSGNIAEVASVKKDITLMENIRNLVDQALNDMEGVRPIANANIIYSAETESAAPSDFKAFLNSWNRSEYMKNLDEAAEELSKALGVSKRKAKIYLQNVNSVAKMIADDKERLDYISSEGKSSFVGNTEYGGSIDFTTLCAKRRLFTGTFIEIQKRLSDASFSATEMLELRQMMKDKGLEVACGLCYVEGSRAKLSEYNKKFIDEYKLGSHDYIPTMYDLNTPTGQEDLRINHPDTYEDYLSYMGKLAQRKPKLFNLRTEYDGEILKKFKNDVSVKAKNLFGGLRLQSFSDFEVPHLIDTMQVILDMSRVGLAGQAYTKVPAFARVFGKTGLKINLSLIAKGVDSDGNLIFDNVEGMDFETAMDIRNQYSENVGTIIVVFDEAQLKAAMADTRIDYIIPFHRSQWSKKYYNLMGLPQGTKDFTNQQNERYITKRYNEKGKSIRPTNYMPNEYWDFSKSGKENAQKYLEMCTEDGRKPKFAKFLQDNKDGTYSLKADGSTDGYWKLLIDFKMYDNNGVGVPQKPVVPEFNMEEATKILDEYKGGANTFPVANEVVDEFVAEYSKRHKYESLKDFSSGFKYAINEDELLNETLEERAERIKNADLFVYEINEQRQKNFDFDTVKTLTYKNAKQYLQPILANLGIFDTKYVNDEMQVEFGFSKTNFSKSVNHQSRDTAANYEEFTYVLSNLEKICKVAYPLEAHLDEEENTNTHLKLVATLISAIKRENYIIPAKLTLKFTDNFPPTLYITVAEQKNKDVPIRVEEPIKTDTSTENVFTIKVADLLETVKDNFSFVKRIPIDLILNDKIKHSLNEPDMNAVEQDVQKKAEERTEIRRVSNSNYEDLLTYEGLDPTPTQKKAVDLFLATERKLAEINANIEKATELRDKAINGKKAAEFEESLRRWHKERAEWERLYNERIANEDVQDLIRKSVRMQLNKLVEKHGSIKPGFNPVREITVPQRTSDNKRVRQTVRTILESGAITDEMIPEIESELLSENFSYVPISDESAKSYAENYLEKYGYEAGMQAWEATLRGDKKIGKNDIALAEYLLQQAAKDGNVKDVLKLSAELSAEGTRAGQTAQAISLLKKLNSPEVQHLGELYYIQKAVDNINSDIEKRFKKGIEKGKVQTAKINEDLAEQLLSTTDENEYNVIVDKIMADVAKQLPSNWVDKWNAWRYLAMLGNPKTHIRNLVGNAIFVPAVEAKNFVGALSEQLLGKKVDERTKAIKVADKYKEFAKNDFDKVAEYITEGSRYDESAGSRAERQIRNQKAVFKTKWLENARKTNSKLLEKEDVWFIAYHYRRALSQYLQANHAVIEELSEGSAMLEKARNYAITEAQKATYRDVSAAAQALNKATNRSSGVKLALDAILPFRSTPINILKRGIEYSPMGLVKTLTYGAYQLKEGKITANQFIDGVSAGFVGIATMMLGALLLALGVLQPAYDDEDEERFDELQGGQEYAFKLFGITYTFDWAAPMSIPFFLGAQFAQFKRDDGFEAKEIFNALSLITEPMFNLSMLDGLNDTIEAVSYSDNKLSSLIINSASSYLQQAIPTLFGQVARTLDGKTRSAYVDKNKAVPEDVQRFIQQVIGKVPGLSLLKEPSINAWGEEKKDHILVRILENFISPGYVERYKTDEIEAELSRLYESTSESSVFVDKGAKYFNVENERKDLTAKEYTTYSVVRGQTSYEMLTDLFNLPEYDGLEDEQKVYVVEKAYDYANVIAKMSISDYDPTGTTYNWVSIANKLYEKNGVPIEQYILFELYRDGSTKRSDAVEAINKLDLTRGQKDALYKAKKFSEKTIDEAPWH